MLATIDLTLLLQIERNIEVSTVDFAQESARAAELHIAPLESRLGERQHRTALGARQCHVEQSALLFEPLHRLDGVLRRKEVVLHSDNIYILELQSLSCVDGHQRHPVSVVGIVLIHIGQQHHVLQPFVDRRLAFALGQFAIA